VEPLVLAETGGKRSTGSNQGLSTFQSLGKTRSQQGPSLLNGIGKDDCPMGRAGGKSGVGGLRRVKMGVIPCQVVVANQKGKAG